MEFKDVIQNRYSCKDFSTQQIEKEKLMGILKAGRVAPTAKNLQEQKIYVVQSKEYLDKIKRPSCCLVGRSFLIIKEIVDNIRRFRPDNREGQSR